MQKSSPLLIQETPRQLLPSLACAIGVNDAIFVQQLHYLLQGSQEEHLDDQGVRRTWYYRSYREWQEDHPYWHVRTIKNIVERNRERGILKTSNFASNPSNRKLWYTIVYENLQEMEELLDRDDAEAEPDVPEDFDPEEARADLRDQLGLNLDDD